MAQWSKKIAGQKTVHSPFEEPDCESCHDDHGETNKLVLVEEGSALCYQCHDDPSEIGELHPIIEDDGCSACHDPHSSNNKVLLTLPASELCVECHDDPADEGVLHPIIEEDGCYACHSPHASANGSLLIEPRTSLCLECHDDPTSKAVPHEAAADGGCVDCHDPHSSKNRSLLIKAGPDLCAECHGDLMEGKLHSIIDEDGCLVCHDPHSSDSAKLLPGPAEGLCQECHDSMIDDGPVVHEAVSDGSCTDCHTPHASKNSPLLLSDQPTLCGECHEIFEEFDKLLHSAITDGECTDCHGAHTAPQPKLLIAPYSTQRYPGTFKPEKFALCFECHDPSLVTGKGEDDVTNFRHGDRNLHDLHVQGQLKPNKYGIVRRGKARSCAGCHDLGTAGRAIKKAALTSGLFYIAECRMQNIEHGKYSECSSAIDSVHECTPCTTALIHFSSFPIPYSSISIQLRMDSQRISAGREASLTDTGTTVRCGTPRSLAITSTDFMRLDLESLSPLVATTRIGICLSFSISRTARSPPVGGWRISMRCIARAGPGGLSR